LPYDIITDVLLVLAVAVLTGEVFEQVGLPSVAGELLSGLILGPTFLGVVKPNPQTDAISSIALFFVVFLIGFEMTTETVRKHIVPSLVATGTSFVLPLAIAAGASSFLLPFGALPDAIVALGISVPSISIISVLVMENDLLKRETGQLILSSVTITDIIAFIILVAVSESLTGTIYVVALTGVFLALFGVFDWTLNSRTEGLQRFLARMSQVTRREELAFALLIVGGLLVAAIFQDIGISYILGAFFAGLLVHDGLIGKEAFRRTADTLARMNRAFFIPIFFGLAGVTSTFPSSDLGLLAPMAVVILASVVPATMLTYWAARGFLRSGEEGGPRRVAFILAGRGAVGIVIASVALGEGLIDNSAYSLVVVATLVVSLLVPGLVGRARRSEGETGLLPA
jgi:Na+:H+ antiporter